jgi:hypothetical protein
VRIPKETFQLGGGVWEEARRIEVGLEVCCTSIQKMLMYGEARDVFSRGTMNFDDRYAEERFSKHDMPL